MELIYKLSSLSTQILLLIGIIGFPALMVFYIIKRNLILSMIFICSTILHNGIMEILKYVR